MISKLLPTLSAQERTRLINALNTAPDEEVVDSEEAGEEAGEEAEIVLYLELKERDLVNEKEIDIYLKHHTIHGEKLSEENKEFLRGQLIDIMKNKGSRF